MGHEQIKTIESAPAPFHRIAAAAQAELARLFPDQDTLVMSDRGRQLAESFAFEALTHHGLVGMGFQHYSAAHQRELLGERSPESLFEDLPQGLLDFYKEKLSEGSAPQRAFDPEIFD